MHLLISGSPSEVNEFLCLIGWTPEGESKLDQILINQEKARMNQTEEIALLKAIDDATSKTGANVQKVADNVQLIATTAGTISDELDALIAAGGIPEEIASKLTDLSQRTQTLSDASQASSDALDAQVPVLQSIAAKGAASPVPVPPPPPPADIPPVG